MPRVTHVKRAQQRYATKPVIDPATGEQKVTPVMNTRTGEQKRTGRRGRRVRHLPGARHSGGRRGHPERGTLLMSLLSWQRWGRLCL